VTTAPTSSDPWPKALTEAAAAALPQFLMRQRWYPAKNAGEPRVRLAKLAPLPASRPPTAAAVWEATPPGQAPLYLFVPLALLPADRADSAQTIAAADGLVVAEATSEDAFIRALVDELRPPPGEQLSELHGAATRAFAETDLAASADWTIRRSRAEQSNTSLRTGESAILKIIRKLEEGPHPELEASRFLNERGFAATPRLLGWIDLDGACGGGASTVAIVQAFVPNQGDGWSWLLDRLRRTEDGAEGEGISWLGRLGERTAEMHKAFAADNGDEAFRPEPIDAADVARWKEDVRRMAGGALDALAAAGGRLAPDDRGIADELLAARDAIGARIDELAPQPHSFRKTRHHGDFHLGQVLVAGGDAVIIDFEGEPMRPLAERRAKHAVLRDVAGMLRSLSYAAATVMRELADGSEREMRERIARWEAQASRSYLDGYLHAIEGCTGVPTERAETERVIRFFMLEKAFYEIAYELANRPDWLAIPLRGARDLVAAASESGCGHRMPFGAEVQGDGRVRFRLWAPAHAAIRVAIDGATPAPMRAAEDGWHELLTEEARAGSRYRFVLPDGSEVPDPASRHQPDDVHGPSEVIDPRAFIWRDGGWRGRPWHEAVVYELHVGAFTPEGTFRAAIDKLDHLVGLGVTAVEIMPIGDFPGRCNWGYDGALPFAPDSSYGRPDDLKALIDAAHGRGVMVLLDVVYNHFGPEGTYVESIAPQFFTERHQTPWGAAINMDGDAAATVRDYFIHNALYWIDEFHFDGLRLDAVHSIIDNSSRHFLEELAERVRAVFPDRNVHLILENEENEASRLVRDGAARPRRYTAQWNDDVHHGLHVAATGEETGYYADYAGRTDRLGRALAEGFAFQGDMMPYRGSRRGEPSGNLPPVAFVAFAQNHDQIGNRAFGERLGAIAPPEAVRAVGAVYLLLPQIPMLFMGEEWAASQPFPFFCDFGPELAAAVREGRRGEFADFPEFRDPAVRERIPDPTAAETFLSAKLAWRDLRREPHAGWLDWYRRILAVRRKEIVPRLPQVQVGGRYRVLGEGAVAVQWAIDEGGQLSLAANLADRTAGDFPPPSGRVIWTEGEVGESGKFGPFAVRWSLQS